ncbi:hypothetical protein Aca07nite_45020 [Actinoplanes capillaceus]|uniref:DUF2637 domain-containing protein n=1 Tax=Actinoplanes campanulatus TaxID=113559 RepID=A0ABQ3WLU8_9ACTN|nr:DUF2637 domain-containing protein [Actinoplanes capillaceus]GID47227.1 hypothetical protein Aca07nite_45020 [Actinoplanes capillaceus]
MKRIEGALLVAILLTVGGFAGAASFTHVKDWTMANSPAGTGEWFGWANAVISELIPMAALLVIRQRRRTGGPVGYPMFLLVCAAGLSLSAQLAVAKPGPSGWLLSAVPALAFLGLSKLVLAPAPAAPAATVPVPATSATTVPAAPALAVPTAPATTVSAPAASATAVPSSARSETAVPTPTVPVAPVPVSSPVTDPVPREAERSGLVPVPVTAFATRPREAAL